MKNFKILVVGKHPHIMKTILRLINGKPRFTGAGAFSVDEAVAMRPGMAFDIVLLGAGLDEEESQQISTFFTVPVVQHYGGGSGLLYAEIYEALGIESGG